MKKALLEIHFAVFLWGFTGVLGRAITIDPVMLVWWRLFITVVTMWLLFGYWGKVTRLPRAAILRIGTLGFILTLHWVTFYAAIKLSNVTITLTCLSTTAFLSALIEPVVFRKRIEPAEILLGLCAVFGIGIIYQTHLQFSVGMIVALVSTLLTVIVSVLNKKLVGHYSIEQLSLYQMTGGWIALTPLVPFYFYFVPAAAFIPAPLDWLWLFILAWVCTIYTFFLWLESLKKLSAFTANLVLTLEPVYGIVLAFMIYRENEHLSRWFYVGFAFVAFSVAFHMWRIMPKKHATPAAIQ